MYQGMNVRSSTIFVLLLALLFQPIVEYASAVEDDYYPQSLFVTVYADGMVDVEYVVSVDPLLVSVQVSLPGVFYENLLVMNERDLPLDSSILDGEVLVDALGSWKLRFFYTTSDLTNKVGRIWLLQVDSPINFTVRLPADATVISISTAPISIWTADGRYFLVMPAGQQEISYIIGAIGSKERALTLINEAQQAINEAKARGADVAGAESKLSEARTALDEGRYAEAELLASEAKEMAEEAPSRTVTPSFDLYWIIGGLAAGGLAVAFLFFRGKVQPRMGKTEREFRQIDVDKILEGRAYLRLEDREAIEFIASAGGEVFEAELRERFRLPKSTVWRLVKRLKREGLVEVEKVGGQNLIRLIQE